MEEFKYLLLLILAILEIIVTALWPIVIYAIIRIILKHKNKSKKSFAILNSILIFMLIFNCYFSYIFAATAKTPLQVIDKNIAISYAEQNKDELPIDANYADGTQIEFYIDQYTKEEYDSFLDEYENNMTYFEKIENRKSKYDFDENGIHYSQMYKAVPNFLSALSNGSWYNGYFVINDNDNYIVGEYSLSYKNILKKYFYVNNSEIRYVIDDYIYV